MARVVGELYPNPTVNAVTILRGNGDGTFSTAQNSTFATGSNPWAIVTADFNRDGKLDLAVGNLQDASLTILLGNGDGTFTPAAGSPITVGGAPSSVAVGDFNSSGRLGIAVATEVNVISSARTGRSHCRESS
jgi:hypothetical protein